MESSHKTVCNALEAGWMIIPIGILYVPLNKSKLATVEKLLFVIVRLWVCEPLTFSTTIIDRMHLLEIMLHTQATSKLYTLN